jgi:hypothetical protein
MIMKKKGAQNDYLAKFRQRGVVRFYAAFYGAEHGFHYWRIISALFIKKQIAQIA